MSEIGKAYLGDGVYVEVEHGMLRLTTQREIVHEIYLEQPVMEALIDYYIAVKKAAAIQP